MTKRKLYFPGLGGNRYETSLDELRDQAYKGKIAREDKVILVEIKDGKTTEMEIPCRKIKGMKAVFSKGEADRRAAKAREEMRKQAVRSEKERKRDEKRAEKLIKAARAQQYLDRWEESAEENPGQFALFRARKLIRSLTIWTTVSLTVVAILGYAVYNAIVVAATGGVDSGALLVSSGGLLLALVSIILFAFIFYRALALALRLTQYASETIAKAIAEATEVDGRTRVESEKAPETTTSSTSGSATPSENKQGE